MSSNGKRWMAPVLGADQTADPHPPAPGNPAPRGRAAGGRSECGKPPALPPRSAGTGPTGGRDIWGLLRTPSALRRITPGGRPSAAPTAKSVLDSWPRSRPLSCTFRPVGSSGSCTPGIPMSPSSCTCCAFPPKPTLWCGLPEAVPRKSRDPTDPGCEIWPMPWGNSPGWRPRRSPARWWR